MISLPNTIIYTYILRIFLVSLIYPESLQKYYDLIFFIHIQKLFHFNLL